MNKRSASRYPLWRAGPNLRVPNLPSLQKLVSAHSLYDAGMTGCETLKSCIIWRDLLPSAFPIVSQGHPGHDGLNPNNHLTVKCITIQSSPGESRSHYTGPQGREESREHWWKCVLPWSPCRMPWFHMGGPESLWTSSVASIFCSPLTELRCTVNAPASHTDHHKLLLFGFPSNFCPVRKELLIRAEREKQFYCEVLVCGIERRA